MDRHRNLEALVHLGSKQTTKVQLGLPPRLGQILEERGVRSDENDGETCGHSSSERFIAAEEENRREWQRRAC